LSKFCNISNTITPKTAATVKRLVMRNGSMGGNKPNMKKIFNIDYIYSVDLLGRLLHRFSGLENQKNMKINDNAIGNIAIFIWKIDKYWQLLTNWTVSFIVLYLDGVKYVIGVKENNEIKTNRVNPLTQHGRIKLCLFRLLIKL
jgi:hypothetical protein